MFFDESQHPRDNEGKFTDKGGGEAKRVFELADQLGIEYNRNTNFHTLQAKVQIALKEKERQFFSSLFDKVKEAVDKYPIYDSRYQHGVNDDRLKSVLDSLGYTDKPKKLTNEEFAKSLKNGGKLYYRGLSESRFVNEFYDGDCFIGQGLSGSGIYMTEDVSEACGFYGKASSDNVAIGIIDSDMRIADKNVKEEWLAFEKQFITDKRRELERNRDFDALEDFDRISKVITYPMFLAMKGYDAYMSFNQKHIVLLNRSKLKVGENPNDIKKYFI